MYNENRKRETQIVLPIVKNKPSPLGQKQNGLFFIAYVVLNI